MGAIIIWALLLGAVGITGRLIYGRMRNQHSPTVLHDTHNCVPEPDPKDSPVENHPIEEPVGDHPIEEPVGDHPIEEPVGDHLTEEPAGNHSAPPKPLTEEELLLEELRRQREKTAALIYRKECVDLFVLLSLGIQTMLATIEEFKTEPSELCEELTIIANNHNLLFNMEDRCTHIKPEPISSAEASYNKTDLKMLIEDEKEKGPTISYGILWDTVMDSLVPCLEGVIHAAQEDRAVDCLRGMAQLCEILAEQQIYPIWYQDEAIQRNAALQLKFKRTSSISIPAFFYCGNNHCEHIGKPGARVITEE